MSEIVKTSIKVFDESSLKVGYDETRIDFLTRYKDRYIQLSLKFKNDFWFTPYNDISNLDFRFDQIKRNIKLAMEKIDNE